MLVHLNKAQELRQFSGLLRQAAIKEIARLALITPDEGIDRFVEACRAAETPEDVTKADSVLRSYIRSSGIRDTYLAALCQPNAPKALRPDNLKYFLRTPQVVRLSRELVGNQEQCDLPVSAVRRKQFVAEAAAMRLAARLTTYETVAEARQAAFHLRRAHTFCLGFA